MYSVPHGTVGNSCSNNVNVKCSPEGDNWRKEINSVVLLAPAGIIACTGAVINNTKSDGKPYILTARHCYDDHIEEPEDDIVKKIADIDAAVQSTIVQFNFETSSCNGSNGFYGHSMSGTNLRVYWSWPDVMLLECHDNIPTEFGPYHSGFDREVAQPQSGVTIHHPRGDVKKIATHNMVPRPHPTCIVMPPIVNFPWWEISPWDSTQNGHSITQHGSSGAPLYNANNRIIGQLTGPIQPSCSSDCQNRSAGFSYFGKFHEGWTGGSGGLMNTFSNLQNWLDSISLDPMEHFGLCLIRDYFIGYNKWVTGDIVKFFNVEVEPGREVVVTELQDRFKANGTLKIPVGATFKVYKP